jgi:hypothetical protein
VLKPYPTRASFRTGGEDVLGESTSYIFKFDKFLALLHKFNSLFHKGTFSFGGMH